MSTPIFPSPKPIVVPKTFSYRVNSRSACTDATEDPRYNSPVEFFPACFSFERADQGHRRARLITKHPGTLAIDFNAGHSGFRILPSDVVPRPNGMGNIHDMALSLCFDLPAHGHEQCRRIPGIDAMYDVLGHFHVCFSRFDPKLSPRVPCQFSMDKVSCRVHDKQSTW